MSEKFAVSGPVPSAYKSNAEASSLPPSLYEFDSLPNAAHVRLPVVMALLGVSRATVWRRCKTGFLPTPKKLGCRITAWNVGELRVVLNGTVVGKGPSTS